MTVEPVMAEIPNVLTLEGFTKPQNILVVGCGGTGAYVIAHLARLITSLNKGGRHGNISLTIADGDKVEEKNLSRQHFVQADLGINKAEALAERYSAAFGCAISVIPSYLENEVSIFQTNPDLLIGCVDNNASRAIIHKWAMSPVRDYWRSRFWIDAGNEENSGQVICGFMPPNDRYYGQKQFSLPCATEVYPSLLENTGKFSSELSCAEMAEAAPQNMMANITAASLVLNFAQKAIRGEPLRTHGVIFSVENSFRSLLNTPENLAKVSKSRRKACDNFSSKL